MNLTKLIAGLTLMLEYDCLTESDQEFLIYALFYLGSLNVFIGTINNENVEESEE